jgi:hypothetical protein
VHLRTIRRPNVSVMNVRELSCFHEFSAERRSNTRISFRYLPGIPAEWVTKALTSIHCRIRYLVKTRLIDRNEKNKWMHFFCLKRCNMLITHERLANSKLTTNWKVQIKIIIIIKIITIWRSLTDFVDKQTTNSVDLSPRANYTEGQTAAGRQSQCQLLRVEGCHVASVTNPYGRNLGFLNRSRYFVFQVAPQLYSRGWVDQVPDPLLLRKSGSPDNRTRTPEYVARNSNH